MSEKIGVGLQYLLPPFTCTEATADVARVAAIQLKLTIKVGNLSMWLSVKLREPLGSLTLAPLGSG